jgi:hypothetical protein
MEPEPELSQDGARRDAESLTKAAVRSGSL